MQNKTLLPILCFLFMASVASAQWNVVQETEKSMSFGVRPCFRLEFSNADVSMVEDLWKDYAKKNFSAKLKKEKKSGEWTATNLKTGLMGSDPFSMYSTVEKMSNGVALNVWFDAGSNFLSRRENSGRTEEVSRSLRLFYYDVRGAVINKEVKDLEDKLKEMEAEQKKMQKDNDALHKDIDNYKAKIKKAEDDIVKNQQKQEANLVDQEAQRRQIEEARQRLNNVENEKN